MSDGDGFSLYLRLAKSQVKLFVHSGDFVDVVKKGDIPESRADSQALSRVISDRRGGGSAVNVEEIPCL